MEALKTDLDTAQQERHAKVQYDILYLVTVHFVIIVGGITSYQSAGK